MLLPRWKLQRDKALYCTLTTPMEQYSSLLIKCRLCRNAQRKPILFDSEHAKSDKHLTAVAERTKAVNILKSIFATNLRCEITNQHLTRDPIPGHPCFVLIIKFDEVGEFSSPLVREGACSSQQLPHLIIQSLGTEVHSITRVGNGGGRLQHKTATCGRWEVVALTARLLALVV